MNTGPIAKASLHKGRAKKATSNSPETERQMVCVNQHKQCQAEERW